MGYSNGADVQEVTLAEFPKAFFPNAFAAARVPSLTSKYRAPIDANGWFGWPSHSMWVLAHRSGPEAAFRACILRSPSWMRCVIAREIKALEDAKAIENANFDDIIKGLDFFLLGPVSIGSFRHVNRPSTLDLTK